jgi:alpha-D-xyloside xylohydrolase
MRAFERTLEQVPAWGREGHALPLGRAVGHTGEIDPNAPVESLRLFGVTRHAPCSMGDTVVLVRHGEGALLQGVNSSQCLPSPGIAVRDTDDGRVLVTGPR